MNSLDTGSIDFIAISLTQSDYAKVIFNDVKDVYSTDADVECQYTITSRSITQKGDKVALFRVGWCSTKDCLVSEDVILQPADGDESIQTCEMKVLFKVSTLPKDDGEYYQFCYVTGNDCICGASTPFTFKSPNADDLVSVEDVENDLLIIRTRTAVMEERLRELAEIKDSLQKKNRCLSTSLAEEKEKSKSYSEQLSIKDEELENAKTECSTKSAEILKGLETELFSHSSEESIRLKPEGYSLNDINTTIRKIKKEKEETDKIIETINLDRDVLKKRLGALVCEHDSTLKKIESLSVEVQLHLSTIAKMKQLISSLEESLKREKDRADRAENTLKEKEAQLTECKLRLSDLEHMFIAMEKSKLMTAEELQSHIRIEENLHQQVAEMKLQLQEMRVTNENNVKKIEDLNNTSNELNLEKNTVAKKYEEAAKEIESLKAGENNHKSIIEDLKHRLKLGGEEYRRKYLEWYHLQKKMTKLQDKYGNKLKSEGISLKDSFVESESMSSSVGAQVPVEERMQRSDNSITLSDNTQSENLKENNSLKDFSIPEVLRLEDFPSVKPQEKSDEERIELPIKHPLELQSSCFSKPVPVFIEKLSNPKIRTKIQAEMERQLVGFWSSSQPKEIGFQSSSSSSSSSQQKAERSLENFMPNAPSASANAQIDSYPYPPYYPYPYPLHTITGSQQIPDIIQQNSVPVYDKEPRSEWVNFNSSEGFNIPHSDHVAGAQPAYHEIRSSGYEQAATGIMPEESYLSCPVCNISFMSDYDQMEIQAHIFDHFSYTCPVCFSIFDKMGENKAAEFEAHVMDHFKDAE